MSTPNTGSRSELDTLTTAELVQDVAYATRVSRQAAEATVNAVFETIRASLAAGMRVELPGLGSLGVRRRGLQAGAKPMVLARRVAYFKPGGELTKCVNSQVGRSRGSTSEAGSPEGRPGGLLLRTVSRMACNDLADEPLRRASVGLTWPPP